MSRTRKNYLLIIAVGSLIVILALLLREDIAMRFPIPQAKVLQAQRGIGKNTDWEPALHHINGLDWALVPAGCFTMGSTDKQIAEASGSCNQFSGSDNCRDELSAKEQPAHQVCFEQLFWIGLTEVTNQEYGSSSSTDMVSMYRAPNWPRETVTWQEAQTFCESHDARLPTEAEWEYAARGPDAFVYPWGNTFDPLYREQAEMLNPQAVASVCVDVSWVGARGMGGNVMEWMADWYGPYSALAQVNPSGTFGGEKRIARGGSWASYASYLIRTAQRNPFDADYASSTLGFRCVRDFDGTQ